MYYWITNEVRCYNRILRLLLLLELGLFFYVSFASVVKEGEGREGGNVVQPNFSP